MSMEHWLLIQITSKSPNFLPHRYETQCLIVFTEIITVCYENNKRSTTQSVGKVLAQLWMLQKEVWGYTTGIQTFYGKGSHPTLWAVGGPLCKNNNKWCT
jgi:hypothetical protein